MFPSMIATLPVHLACQLICHSNYSMDNITFAMDTPTPKEILPQIPAGYTPFHHLGVAYKYFEKHVTWQTARDTCVEDGTDLAIIDSEQKFRFARSLVDDKTHGTWVGIRRNITNDDWFNVKTGSQLTELPWDPVRYDGDCLIMYSTSTGLIRASCTDMGPTLCEFSWENN